jgi:hypothetical protein
MTTAAGTGRSMSTDRRFRARGTERPASLSRRYGAPIGRTALRRDTEKPQVNGVQNRVRGATQTIATWALRMELALP